jgi:uncharacterized protein (TIGR00725 family)
MKKIVGVMGPGEMQATNEDLACAFEVGKIVGQSGAALLCGGMKGTMIESARGSKEVGGITIGIGPTQNKTDMNEYIDYPLLTNMHAGRNYMNVISSDILIFVSIGSPGTLSELAYAIQVNRPSIIIRGSDKLRAYVEDIKATNIVFVTSLDELSTKLRELLSK